MESFVQDRKLNGERFDLFCFVFVCDCTSLALAELSYNFSIFFSVKKREQELTDSKCINFFHSGNFHI